MPATYAQALSLVGVTVPAHLAADAEVPVLSGVQAQGDLLVVPAEAPDDAAWHAVSAGGVAVIQGEATGHTHWLHAGFGSSGVAWAWVGGEIMSDELVLGYLRVPAGQSALLIHTDEHGANGIGPGRYAVRRKREAGDRYVED